MPVIYLKHITRADAKNNPNAIFIFGDNDERVGFGGLAKELRNEPNAYGIRVKKKPTTMPDAYYIDKEYKDNIWKITEDINHIVDAVNKNPDFPIIFPADGIGTGLARMKSECPRTYETMLLLLDGILEIKNGVR